MLAQVNELRKCVSLCVQANQKQILIGHLIKLEVCDMCGESKNV